MRLGLFLTVLVALDLVVVLSLKPAEPLPASVLQPGSPSQPDQSAPPDPATQPQDANWALCLTRFNGKPVTPTSVAITYLDPELDYLVKPEQVRSWFGSLDPMVVDVYKLEQSDGRRRISFELNQSKWPDWQKIAGNQTGETVCSLIRAALLDAKIGRPVDSQSDGSAGELAPSRHHFEFIYARRPALYRTIEWVGTLDYVLDDSRLDVLQGWLGQGAQR